MRFVISRMCCLLSILSIATGALATQGSNPFEPTVTRKESELLSDALERARDDPATGIALLEEHVTEKSSAALDFAVGNFHFQSGDLGKAEAAYRAATAKKPLFRSALNNLARVVLMQDRPSDAMEVFQALVRDGQGDAESYLLLGHCLLLQGKAVQSEGAYRQSLVLAPDGGDAIRGLIKSLIEQQRNAEVLALTTDLQSGSPGDAELWNLRANAHLSLDQFDAAVRSLETARLLSAASPDMLKLLGDLYLNRNQSREAVAAFREAFAGDTPSVDHMLQASRGLLHLGELEEAAGMLRRVSGMTQSPGQVTQGKLLLARLAVLQERFAQASVAYEAVIRENPLEGDAILALADLEERAGEVEEARILLERAARIDGFEARALVRHAQLEVGQGNYGRAVPLLERAQVFTNRPTVRRYLEQVRRLASH